MYEFLFKYSRSVFHQGSFVFLSGWPTWLLWTSMAAAAIGLGYLVWQKWGSLNPVRSVAIWLLQAALAMLLLLMAWRPALSVATLKPQQNIVAVLVDDSSSMATADENKVSRKDSAAAVLNAGLLNKLKEKFQVRVYKMSDHLDRIDALTELSAQSPATHIGESLKQVVADASSLPIGAIVLMSDGADNTGGVDAETLSGIRRQQIPIHTIGFGREQMEHDLEISNVELPARSLPDSRLSAVVSFHNHGYGGQKAKLTIRENDKVLASQVVTLKSDATEQIETVLFNAGKSGVKVIQAFIDPLPGEENARNNIVTRVVNVDDRKPRILYLDGEPRWEFKFLRRGVEDDKTLDLVTMVRTAPNKLYRQGVKSADELKDGFPTTVEELFAFDGLIFGSVDAAYLTPAQLQMVRDFVDRRGGGALFVAGKDSLSDGGWQSTVVNDILPTAIPDHKGTFKWTPSDVRLTPEGADSLITRLEDDPIKNGKKWESLPYVRNLQDVGQPKLGAVKLVEAIPKGGGGGAAPLLVTMNYGRGRTAVFATSGSWRWQMLQDVKDMSHEMFYQQLLRWLVSNTPKHVTGSTPKSLLADESKAKLRAEVRDKTFLPAGDAIVEAHILGEGVTETVPMTPEPSEQGVFSVDWQAPKPGSYLIEVVAHRGTEELGRDSFTLRREDGTAENFHVEQNKALLTKLSSETGGNYYTPSDAQKLGEDINYSNAGINVRESKDLWDMPAFFILILLMRGVEWLLRRRWGVI
ncbi:MAG: glutamine amidotransferase [Acidobacteriota bacterium]